MRVQFEMSNRARFAELLYALAMPEEAERRAFQAVTAPDRSGMTSSSRESLAFSNAVLHWATLDASIEHDRERASVRGFMAGLGILFGEWRRVLMEWERRRAAIALGSTEDNMVNAVRPYFLDVMDWYVPVLNDMLGAGVFLKAVRDACAADAGFGRQLDAYYDAFEGEVAWREGSIDDAVRLGESAIEGLPREARLLGWRVEAWLADALVTQGRDEAAATHFHELLQKYPTALRHLRIRLPVAITHDGNTDAEEAASRLADSPRLRTDRPVFRVHVSGSGRDLTVCLDGAGAFNYGCVRGFRDESEPETTPDPSDDDERRAMVLDRFHDRLFSPKVDLTHADINTLDGRIGRMDADKAVKDILGEDGAGDKAKSEDEQ
jgi:hypothetical protein